MKQLKQQGSAHAVIIVILVLALVGTLGFVFWQNFIQKDKDADAAVPSTQTVTPVVKAPVLKTYAFNSAFKVGFGFSYPEGWTLASTTEGPVPLNADAGPTQEIVTVTSPSKDIFVKYHVAANGGLGGACDASDPGVGTIGSISVTPLPSLTAGSYTEYSIKNPTGYEYYSGIMNIVAVTNVKINDSACNVYMANILSLAGGTGDVQLLGANIHVKAFDNSDGNSKNSLKLADIEAAYKTGEYKQAKAILVSTTLTK